MKLKLSANHLSLYSSYNKKFKHGVQQCNLYKITEKNDKQQNNKKNKLSLANLFCQYNGLFLSVVV